MSFDKDEEDMIGYLEEEGAIIWEGMDEQGEALFKFNLPRLKEVMPELYDDVMADIDADLMKLYEEGLVELEYDENLNALFRPTQKAIKILDSLRDPFDN